MVIKFFELSILLILALISDKRTYKIKNQIVYPLILVGLITNIYLRGIFGLKESLLGIIIPIVLLFVIYVLRMLGAGDIKLFSAIGAIMGVNFVAYTIVYSIISGGVISIIILVTKKNGGKRVGYLMNYLKVSFLNFNLLPYENFDNKSGGDKFHFSYAIFCGTVVQILHTFFYINI